MNSNIKNFKFGIIIPIYNVEDTILDVLQSLDGILDEAFFEILFIDNNSKDNCLEIISTYLKQNFKLAKIVTIIQHNENYGYGTSIKAGFEYFTIRDISHILVIHGDFQVEPSWLIRKFIYNLYSESDVDLILASRFMNESNIENYSIIRKYGNYFFNLITIFCTGYRMSDSGSAMILVKKEIILNIPFLTLSNTWQFHPQLNIYLYSLPDIKIREISMNWSDSKVKSTVPLVRYGIILLKMLLLYWINNIFFNKKNVNIFRKEFYPSNRSFKIFKNL